MLIVGTNSFEENRFKTISDFEDCMVRNAEVEFMWAGQSYSITHPDKISICEAYKPETEKFYDTADEVLEYLIDGLRLREIITKVEVYFRGI